MAAVALTAVVLGGKLLAGLVIAVVIVMAFEWTSLAVVPNGEIRRLMWAVVAAPGVAALMLLTMGATATSALIVLGIGIVLAGGAASLQSALSVGRTAGGAFYVGLPAVALVWLRYDPARGLGAVLWLLAVVWSTDITAYFVGRALGGPKLAPAISPGKTWSGLGGAVAGAGLAGFVMSSAIALSALSALLLGAVLAVIAQGGDLLESWFKRQAGVKDSGTLIPGHGGTLDRLDGLLTAAPVLAVVLALAGAR